ncbi:uncharacterized protein LOC134301197 isoform X2 [Trichomycterus rosablanca]|uniref:uncharacterized protein LOC134301197 isoform X2 n=1 Tax=Trichomycterus rosablanca TaxID=2290929 RepID=UPI002F34FC1B
MLKSTKMETQEDHFPGEHLTFQSLREKIRRSYLNKYQFIPRSPHPVEFHVSNLRHDTNFSGFEGILGDGGFKDPQRGLLWWSLSVSDSEIKDAEKHFLRHESNNNFDVDYVKPFLHKFTSSPAFRKSSRLGNFRFTFSIKELLNRYSEQFCMGQTPQMRIYGTVVYKQEVMYAIVVHGLDGQTEFGKCPLFQCSTVCEFQNEKILWKPEGMSNTHSFRLGYNLKAHRVPTRKRKYYMWDHVAMVFHVPKDKVFEFNKEMLLKHLSFCQGAEPKIITEEFIKCDFEVSTTQEQA